MPKSMPAPAVLDREFFEVRAKILEIAASLDRLDRGEGAVGGDRRMDLIRKGLQILSSDRPNRAEEVQLLFSRKYENEWRQSFGLAK